MKMWKVKLWKDQNNKKHGFLREAYFKTPEDIPAPISTENETVIYLKNKKYAEYVLNAYLNFNSASDMYGNMTGAYGNATDTTEYII